MRFRSLGLLASALLISACGDSSGPGGAAGPLASFAALHGDQQTALAGTALPQQIVIVPQDASGRTVPDQTPTFTVIAGGGFLSSSTGQVNPDGSITAPTWTLGKSAVPQQMQVSMNGTTKIIDATVKTSYKLEVRFFGAPLKTAQKDLFTAAAARIMGMIVGAVPLVGLPPEGEDPSFCTGTPTPVLTGTIDGLLIYAAVDSIDGPGNVLANAGPCAIRTDATGGNDYRTVYGRMKFDSADVRTSSASELQMVILHEMLHVVGFGLYWGRDEKNLLINEDAPGTAYIGAGGVAGCKATGATVTCATSVPVEDCVATPNCGAGTVNSHWKESRFGSELMTGFLNFSSNPLSVMSVRSFDDLGYTSNPAAADSYTLVSGSLNATNAPRSALTASPVWERPANVRVRALPTYPLNFTRPQ